jgi:hypothetical protein
MRSGAPHEPLLPRRLRRASATIVPEGHRVRRRVTRGSLRDFHNVLRGPRQNLSRRMVHFLFNRDVLNISRVVVNMHPADTRCLILLGYTHIRAVLPHNESP